MKIFDSVRVNRNESLLDILGIVAKSKRPPVSRIRLQKTVRKTYSNIHKNINFLEKKGFLRITQTRARKEHLYDLTIKGALASLFSSHINELTASKLFEIWRVKDWGPGYDKPFVNVRDGSELKELVETIYLHGGSLEDVNEDILKRSLGDPREVQRLIRHGKITLSKRIDEGGTYDVTMPHVPASVGTLLTHENQDVKFLIAPDSATSKILYDLVTSDLDVQKTIEMHLLQFVQALAYDFKTKGRGVTNYHYFSDSRISVLTLTIPENVASLLSYPERILEYTRGSFDDLIRPFLQDPDFVQGTNPIFTFRALRYDPKSKDLLPLSRLEIKEKAYHVLERLQDS